MRNDKQHFPEHEKAAREEAAGAVPRRSGPEIATVAFEGIGPVTLLVEPAGAKPQRIVGAKIGETRHHDRIDTASAARRKQFVFALAEKANAPAAALYAALDARLVELGEAADKNAAADVTKGRATDDAPQSQATAIAGMTEGLELWHTPAGDAYATIIVRGHHENWPVRSQAFKRQVAKSFYESTGRAANTEAVSAALNLVEAQAVSDGDEHPVFVRVAEHNGRVYIDLCDREWRAVEITESGWSTINEPPVKFRRTKGMRPLPPPERGGRVDDLRQFVNVEDSDWPIVVAWLVGTFCPRGPYPVLCLFATQGAGKSNTAKFLRAMVDPNAAPLRAEPKDAHDLIISTNGSWCITYDNLSHLHGWLSDALCRLSTGGGFATRELYSNDDEVIFDAMRPTILTSIVELAERSDLLDRCLPVSLPPLAANRRRTEKVLWADFDAARPKILGALFDAVAGALLDLPRVHIQEPPRMADFAVWATAAERGLGWEPGAFLRAYTRNRGAANELALEASPIAGRLMELLTEEGQWEGTANELLNDLDATFDREIKRPPGWPKNARSLSTHVRRLAPNLTHAGWRVDFAKSGDGRKRLMTFDRVATDANEPTAASNGLPSAQEALINTEETAFSDGRTLQTQIPGNTSPKGHRRRERGEL